jgi:hypothetical protein
MYKSLIRAAVQTGILAVATYGQLDFSYLNSNAVREGKWTGTRMDSVSIETTVGNGVAKTKLTFSVEPQGYYDNKTISLFTPDTVWNTTYQYNNKTGQYDSIGRTYNLRYYRIICDTIPEVLDSVEISHWFTLPTDFVAKNMWLWINGQPEKAYIQDKMLAEQQYNKIVGQRKDPALLTYNGNGSYMFRMFPLKSYVARKVAIEFEHTFIDSHDVITAKIPVSFDTSHTYWYWNGQNTNKSGIRHVKVQLKTTDSKTYSFTMPGIGKGTFSKEKDLILEANNVTTLGAGNIDAADPSGTDVYAWSSLPESASHSEMGFATVIAESTVVLSAEPDTRIIVLDIHKKMWCWADYYKAHYTANGNTYNDSYFSGSYYEEFNMWDHARKLAVLALKSYVDKDEKFNLIINGKVLFEKPVQGNESNLSDAFSAIVAASPDESASTVQALKTATDQAGENAVIFITDLMTPQDAVLRPSTTTTSNTVVLGDTNTSARYYNSQIDSCKKVMEQFKGNLFVICDEFNSYYYSSSFYKLANASGGYQLTSLHNRYFYPYYYNVAQDKNSGTLPRLPRLYIDQGGISDVKVTFADSSSDDIKYTTDGHRYWWGRGDILLMGGILLKTMWYPGYYNPTSCILRVAFKSQQGMSSGVKMTITGKMGGLRFTKNVNLRPDVETGTSSDQWAFRYAEQCAQTTWNSSFDWSYWKTLQDSIKAIGYKYHIVTTNTALLALEPGMTLTVDSANATAQNDANAKMDALSIMPNASSVGSSSGHEWFLDNISLDDLISDNINTNGRTRVPSAKQESFSIKVIKSQIMLSIPVENRNCDLQLAIYNLAGRLVASHTVTGMAAQNSQFVWDLSSKRNTLSNGAYVLKIRAGSIVKVLKMPSLR